jgi:hypothetical protein
MAEPLTMTVARHPMRDEDAGEACKFCGEPATYRLCLTIGESVLWSFGCSGCATSGRMRAEVDALVAGSGAEIVEGRCVDESPFRVPTVSPNRQGWRAMAIIAAARKWLKGAPESYHVDQASLCLDDLADALQGQRARLANVERLLVKCIENQDGDWMDGSYPPLEEALAEIRAMIDGDGE